MSKMNTNVCLCPYSYTSHMRSPLSQAQYNDCRRRWAVICKMERMMCDCCLSLVKAAGSSLRCCQGSFRTHKVPRSICSAPCYYTDYLECTGTEKQTLQLAQVWSLLCSTIYIHHGWVWVLWLKDTASSFKMVPDVAFLNLFYSHSHLNTFTKHLTDLLLHLSTQALCSGMDVSAGARWWHSSLCTRLPDAPTACSDCMMQLASF